MFTGASAAGSQEGGALEGEGGAGSGTGTSEGERLRPGRIFSRGYEAINNNESMS